MCQFHQVTIIRRYITKNPKLPVSIDLKELVAMLKMRDKESFEGALEDCFVKWKDFLNERTTNIETGRSYHPHKCLRSAYRSLKSNLLLLVTWYDYIN